MKENPKTIAFLFKLEAWNGSRKSELLQKRPVLPGFVNSAVNTGSNHLKSVRRVNEQIKMCVKMRLGVK